jgi:hypothetical protein
VSGAALFQEILHVREVVRSLAPKKRGGGLDEIDDLPVARAFGEYDDDLVVCHGMREGRQDFRAFEARVG